MKNMGFLWSLNEDVREITLNCVCHIREGYSRGLLFCIFVAFNKNWTVFKNIFNVKIYLFQLYKCIKKGMKQKTYVRNGLKDVQARIRKGERGIVVFAGDVTPIEVMCHLPAVCEEKNLVRNFSYNFNFTFQNIISMLKSNRIFKVFIIFKIIFFFKSF